MYSEHMRSVWSGAQRTLPQAHLYVGGASVSNAEARTQTPERETIETPTPPHIVLLRSAVWLARAERSASWERDERRGALRTIGQSHL